MAFGRKRVGKWDGVDRRAAAIVLVVTDEPGSATLLSGLLARVGYRVETADGHYTALACMADKLPRCVVLDLRVGGVGANLKTLDSIRAHEDRRIATARVVLCALNRRNRSFSFQSGADGFLVHPFHAADLVAAVGEVLAVPEDQLPVHRRGELDQRKFSQ